MPWQVEQADRKPRQNYRSSEIKLKQDKEMRIKSYFVIVRGTNGRHWKDYKQFGDDVPIAEMVQELNRLNNDDKDHVYKVVIRKRK